ncbi:thiol-disulfide isomerase/thioredoxin [Roseivirga ehrenbergii]|uniref:Thioredoxin domain-containing protein n=1 Tax=Roseivirga ehrenbergii (strain DSM 102268 / JCM 13514 / KCTC 12282 / NCIMB 14502 / KMM 6017) TaxID=279360 RepID=A0A150X8A5_ROSEK|nr:redoxin domain-containing protein [Roseivirga ehrenbergii]KYG74948.1 hypothetical protein MB14_07030 [Roseivirga ehrenbergii]TCL13708.1 thiol-disulfide isomerase/thioredoxin [Roseivirga ehrenbergii]
MKALYFPLAFLVFTVQVFGQTLKIGDSSSDLKLSLMDKNKTSISFSELEGKVVMIDFWATWCSPCIAGMPHLNDLQNEFNENLQIIAVSHESEDRIKRFINSRPQAFLFGLDNANNLQKAFPHSIIPHTVLINPNGKVVAITAPENINLKVIEQVLKGETIDLPLKTDIIDFDYADDYFKVDSTIAEHFVIQPYNASIPSFSKRSGGIFANRRLTIHNAPISSFFRAAFQVSSYRLVYEVDETQFDYENTDNLYNLDIIVAPEDRDQFYPIFQSKLNELLEVKGRIGKQEKEIAVLYKIDSLEFGLNPVEEHTNYSGRGDYFKSAGASMDDFREYLENFGLFGLPVVNDTGIDGYFSLEFSFDPETKGSFQENLRKIGLGIKKNKREIDVLILYTGA